MPDRHYKGYRLYAYIALARLASELDLDLSSPELEAQLPAAIGRPVRGISKEEVLRAIRSNSHMTDKVVDHLVAEGFATVAHDGGGYQIRITAAGVAHLRKYRVFYRELYARELAEHYQYTGTPGWMR